MDRTKLSVLSPWPGMNDGLQPIVIPPMPKDDRQYVQNDFEGFHEVFTKDNMPTYHQLYDNFLHWIWNEYDNEPEKYESDEYKASVLDKVFIWINARIMGIIDNGSNHAEIIQFLEKYWREDAMDIIAAKREELDWRRSPFTKEDAVVWWELGEQIWLQKEFRGLTDKPIVIPVFKHEDSSFAMTESFDLFYILVFNYVYDYYQYVYTSKFKSQWVELYPEDHIIYFPMQKKDVSFINGQMSISNGPTKFFSFQYQRVGELNIPENDYIVAYIYSDQGELFTDMMDTYTTSYIAYFNGRYYVSSMRSINLVGFDKFGMAQYWKLPLDILTAKARSREAIRTDMWRDIMECGAILFPFNHLKDASIKIRITNYDKYADQLTQFISNGIVQHLGEDEKNATFSSVDFDTSGFAIIRINDLEKLMEFWKVLEHTLDFWVQFGTKWSLVCNIQWKEMSFYYDNPHIDHDMWLTIDETRPPFTRLVTDRGSMDVRGKMLSIIPRDGMTWTIPKLLLEKTYTNDLEYKKIYH
jgi:hypothetical protein